MLKRIALIAGLVTLLSLMLTGPAAQAASSKTIHPATALTSGHAVSATVPAAAGVNYTITGVSGQHVTVAATNLRLTARVVLSAYDASKALITNSVFQTGTSWISFTPNQFQAGTISISVVPFDASATGTLTLTYATDVKGTLSSGVTKPITLKYQGQQANLKFTGVAGQHITLALSNPSATARLVLSAFNANGASLGSTIFQTAPSWLQFTPSAVDAGPITVILAAFDPGSLGSVNLTYAVDSGGSLAASTTTSAAIVYQGQQSVYSFTATASQHFTVAVTNPMTTGRLTLALYNASNALLTSSIFSTSPTYLSYTATRADAGTLRAVISNFDPGATGTFTIERAGDTGGAITPGTTVNGATTVYGQHAVYTFTAVAGKTVTVSIKKPITVDGRMQLNVYDASGAADVGALVFQTAPGSVTFVPSTEAAGPTSIVIGPYDTFADGTFQLTLTQV